MNGLMGSVTQFVERVKNDEPCYGYFTGPLQMLGYTEDDNPRMVEIVRVVRRDQMCAYVQDFGCADDFEYVPPLMMPSFGENPVGLMQWHGERHRNDPKWAKRIKELKESSTLFADVIRQEEQRSEVIRNLTVVGPHVTIQRNGYSQVRNRRNYRDELARRTGKSKFFT